MAAEKASRRQKILDQHRIDDEATEKRRRDVQAAQQQAALEKKAHAIKAARKAAADFERDLTLTLTLTLIGRLQQTLRGI